MITLLEEFEIAVLVFTPLYARITLRSLPYDKKFAQVKNDTAVLLSVIVEQVANGVSVRMAILYLLLAGNPEGEVANL